MGVKGDLGSFVDCLVFKRDANHKLSETDTGSIVMPCQDVIH